VKAFELLEKKVFIDLFAGCGGLSLGLMRGGWKGLFAIEQSPDAFKTLKYNLIDEDNDSELSLRYDWPDWLEKAPLEISAFIKMYEKEIRSLKGEITLVAGGPPCQGFSFAGKRTGDDPRNELFEHHLEIVDMVKPVLVLMENVQGISVGFKNNPKGTGSKKEAKKSYAAKIKKKLYDHGYEVFQEVIWAKDYGVPQLRPRFFTLGISRDYFNQELGFSGLEGKLKEIRENFLVCKYRGLGWNSPVTLEEAISDLLVSGKEVVPCTDEESPRGFQEPLYQEPKTTYQEIMRSGLKHKQPNSMRLPRHKQETLEKFEKILAKAPKGKALPSELRKELGINKKVIVPLAPDKPSKTLTTLPDDYIHYSEPRILTPREYARVQSFPDWFSFKGKFTTGGRFRKKECPRYTQIGNAVPPMLAEAIGIALLDLLRSIKQGGQLQ